MEFYDLQILHRSKWLVRIRWLWIVFVLGAIIIAHQVLHLQLPLFPLLILLIILLLYNTAMALIISQGTRIHWTPSSRRVMRWQLMIDFVLLAFFLHYSGGIENPFGIYFIFHVIGSSLLLNRTFAFIQTSIGVLLYLLVVLLEYFRIIPHYGIFHQADVPLCLNPVYMLADVGALASALFFAAFMATTISQELRSRDRALERYNKLLLDQDRKKSEYVLMISHDLQEPIATIQNCIQLVLQGYSGTVDDEARKTLERASVWAQKLIHYVRDLLRLSRLKVATGESLKPVCINCELEKAISEYQAKLKEKSIHFVCSLPDKELWIRGDSENLYHLFGNLLANATKYTPANGTIGLEVKNMRGKVIMEVWDTGIGIPKEYQQKVFDEFFRTPQAVKNDPHGTGLGLAIVKHIVDFHNGTIAIKSPHDKHPQLRTGTCFILEFPELDRIAIEKRELLIEQSKSKKGEGEKMDEQKRILIIDDNPDIVANARIVLESKGYKVYDAQDGESGLEMVKKVRPHLIILDIMMKSETEGFHVAYKLRSPTPDDEMNEFRDVPILVVSSIHDKTAYRFDNAVGTEWLPVDAFVDKPVSPEELIKRVEEMIGTKG